jgi:hypothetical protein
MTKPNDPPAAFTVMDGDVRIVSFCCDVALYTGTDLSTIPSSVLHIYEKFLTACPPDRLRWYSTENMTRHKPCTPRALDMLRGWLKPGAPARKVINIHLTDGERLDYASEYSFWVYGKEPGDLKHGVHANVIRCAFPGSWGVEKPGELLAFARDMCEHFPFQSGHAGLVLETSEYKRSQSHVAAWRLSMQHPGMDISNLVTDPVTLRREAIKGVNWLTILGAEFTDRVGGVEGLRQELPDSVGVLQV